MAQLVAALAQRGKLDEQAETSTKRRLAQPGETAASSGELSSVPAVVAVVSVVALEHRLGHLPELESLEQEEALARALRSLVLKGAQR